jgi:TPR repeat protein
MGRYFITLFLIVFVSFSPDCTAQETNFALLIHDANSGIPEAETQLGIRYYKGDEVLQNQVEAAKWFQKSADQGDVTGQLMLGLMYQDGRGVQQDFKLAAKWIGKAAKQGDPQAQSALGMLYAAGKGVIQNNEDAFFWISLGDVGDSKSDQQRQSMAAMRILLSSKLTPQQIAEVQTRIVNWHAD